MIQYKRVLATICARGGSKAIKLKNIRKLGNKPLILHTLDLIKDSKYIDDYVISSDSKKIIEVCKNNNYKIEFQRPDFLAKDKISRIEAIKHAAKWKNNNGEKKYDIIIDLGVATPFKTTQDIDSAIELFSKNNFDRVTSVKLASKNPYYNMLENNNGKIKLSKNFKKEITDRRDAPIVYDMNDAINVWSFETLMNGNNDLRSEKLGVYLMPYLRSIDIDEEYDFIIAEALINGGLNAF